MPAMFLAGFLCALPIRVIIDGLINMFSCAHFWLMDDVSIPWLSGGRHMLKPSYYWRSV